MNYRDWLQQVIYKIINPVVRGMIKIGITPNFITTTGLVLNIVAAGVLIYGGINGERGDLSYVGWGGGYIVCRAIRHDGWACGPSGKYEFHFRCTL